MSISLSAYDPAWPAAFEQEAVALRSAFGPACRAVHHIGSTAVPGLLAKPIIDILVAVSALDKVGVANPAMIRLGYESMGAFGISGRRYFRKIAAGLRTHHVHIFEDLNPHLLRHLAFRDFLIAHPDAAAEYAALKLALAGPDSTWDSYINGKDHWVKATEARAIAWYQTRARAPDGS